VNGALADRIVVAVCVAVIAAIALGWLR